MAAVAREGHFGLLGPYFKKYICNGPQTTQIRRKCDYLDPKPKKILKSSISEANQSEI